MTREKVIDILKGIKDGTACLMPNMPEDGEKAIDIAIKAVEQFEPHWIPVTERLPESKEEDLEYPTVIIDLDGQVALGCYYESTREWGMGEYFDQKCFPIAWMPLPEPYKGVTE